MKLPQPVLMMISRKNIQKAVLKESFIASFYMPDKQVVTLAINEGFDFDGASIPKCLWSIVGSPWCADTLPAALVHDALYATELLPRSTADKIFYDLLRRQGVSRSKAWAMYLAVKAFGWRLWPHKSYQIDKTRQYCNIKFFPRPKS